LDRKCEAQSFRSEVDGFVPLSQRSLSGASTDRLSLIATSCESGNHFEISQSDAFAAPGFHLASGIFGSDCGIRVEPDPFNRVLPKTRQTL
jgi:hypothetical protein